MKAFLRVALALSLLLTATSSFAWGGSSSNWGPFGNNGWGNNGWGNNGPGNNGWGNNGWGNNYNQYDEWDPRYWMEEMENTFDNDNYGGSGPYGSRPYGYGGPGGSPGAYGPPPGYYGPPPGYYGGRPGSYGTPQGYAPNNGQRPYGPPPGYAPRGSAPQPQQAPQQ